MKHEKKIVNVIFFLIFKSLHIDMSHLKQGCTLPFYCYGHVNMVLWWHFSVLISYSPQSHNLFNWVKMSPLKREEALVSRVLRAEKWEEQNKIKPPISFPLSQSSSGSQLIHFVNWRKYHFYIKNSIQQKSELETNG